jgi:hypothetical protein
VLEKLDVALWDVLRFFEEPSASLLGVNGELDSDATARCMNFMVISRADIVLGVDGAAAILGRVVGVGGMTTARKRASKVASRRPHSPPVSSK